jgi:hypothetical protein
MHDGAPPHFLLALRAFLNVFSKHLVGRVSPTAWPLRPPDLNPLDFFYLLEHLKFTLYAKEFSDVQDLQQRRRV